MVTNRGIISDHYKEVYWTKYWHMNLCMTKHYFKSIIIFTFANTIFNPNVSLLITKIVYTMELHRFCCKNENISRIKTFVGKQISHLFKLNCLLTVNEFLVFKLLGLLYIFCLCLFKRFSNTIAGRKTKIILIQQCVLHQCVPFKMGTAVSKARCIL